MRGRNDELSQKYLDFTVTALEEEILHITKEGLDRSYKRLKKEMEHYQKGQNNSIKKALTKPRKVKSYKKEFSLSNDKDVMMVLDCLKFISNGNRKNVYNYLKTEIERTDSGLEKVYNELDDIYGIGDKIATFIIRDIALINSGLINKNDYKMAFPVDTWVRKIALAKFGCTEKDSDEQIKIHLIKKCKECNVNPLKFAAGLWYLGANSLDLLVEKLEEVEF